MMFFFDNSTKHIFLKINIRTELCNFMRTNLVLGAQNVLQRLFIVHYQ